MNERFDPASQNLMNLVNKYGLKKIPPEELKALGYTYDENSNIVNINELAKRNEPKKENEIEIEKKKERTPFGRIEIGLDTGDFQLRHEIELSEGFDKEYRLIETVYDILPANKPLKIFLDSFQDYIARKSILAEDPLARINDWVNSAKFNEILNHEALNRGHNGVNEDLNIENGLASRIEKLILTDEEEIKEFYEDIQRARARYTDESALKSEFYKWYQDDNIEAWSSGGKVLQYFKDHEITNSENLSMDMSGLFLIENGFNRLGQDISKCKTFPEAEVRLDRISGEDFPHLAEKKKIEGLMKSAHTIEEKKLLSKQKKELDEQSRKENFFIEGLNQYIRQYETVAKFFEQYLDKIEADCFRIYKNESKKQDYYFDATINPELDKDPGQISGDCTTGKPLPFSDPSIPVYNVKVFENETKHIGNIYLLATTTKDGEPVWHLDAVQIPALLNWAVAVKQLVEGLGHAAKLKGIKYITINNESEIISNYDYIGNAFMAFAETLLYPDTKIKVPVIDERIYSNFQYSGEAYIVWENK